MNKNAIIFILIAGILAISYLWYSSSSDHKEEIQLYKNEIKQLEDNYVRLSEINDSLADLEPEIIERIDTLYLTLKKQQNETDKIPDSVATYAERKLDSILTNYRFKPRAKSADSISNWKLRGC